MRKSYLGLEKYWVTLSNYFRLATTVALGMGITYWNLLYCHGVAEENVDKKISTLEYNNRTVYNCFNNPLLQMNLVSQTCIYLQSPSVIDPTRIKDPNIPQICSHLKSMLLLKILLVLWPPPLICQISFLLMILILYMLWRNMCVSNLGRTEDAVVGKRCYKKKSIHWYTCSDKNNKFYYCHGFSRIFPETRNWFLKNQHSM